MFNQDIKKANRAIKAKYRILIRYVGRPKTVTLREKLERIITADMCGPAVQELAGAIQEKLVEFTGQLLSQSELTGDLRLSPAGLSRIRKLILQEAGRRTPVGMLVGIETTEQIRVGWSKCCRCDTFNHEFGFYVASRRALTDREHVGPVPDMITHALPRFLSTLYDYFKPSSPLMRVSGQPWLAKPETESEKGQ